MRLPGFLINRPLSVGVQEYAQATSPQGLQDQSILAQQRFEKLQELLEAERAQKTQLQSELDEARKIKESLEDDADIQRKQLGLKLWNEGLAWAVVAEKLDGTPENWKAVKEEIRRFARNNKLEIRLGKPGAKRQT